MAVIQAYVFTTDGLVTEGSGASETLSGKQDRSAAVGPGYALQGGYDGPEGRAVSVRSVTRRSPQWRMERIAFQRTLD